MPKSSYHVIQSSSAKSHGPQWIYDWIFKSWLVPRVASPKHQCHKLLSWRPSLSSISRIRYINFTHACFRHYFLICFLFSVPSLLTLCLSGFSSRLNTFFTSECLMAAKHGGATLPPSLDFNDLGGKAHRSPIIYRSSSVLNDHLHVSYVSEKTSLSSGTFLTHLHGICPGLLEECMVPLASLGSLSPSNATEPTIETCQNMNLLQLLQTTLVNSC